MAFRENEMRSVLNQKEKCGEQKTWHDEAGSGIKATADRMDQCMQ